MLVKCFYFYKGVEGERRSRWDRWGLTRGRRDKTVSQPDIPTAISRDNSSIRSRQYSKLASGKKKKITQVFMYILSLQSVSGKVIKANRTLSQPLYLGEKIILCLRKHRCNSLVCSVQCEDMKREKQPACLCHSCCQATSGHLRK